MSSSSSKVTTSLMLRTPRRRSSPRPTISRITIGEREIASRSVGEMVMEELRHLDEVGYVRFASVYKGFEDTDDFAREIGMLVKTTAPKLRG